MKKRLKTSDYLSIKPPLSPVLLIFPPPLVRAHPDRGRPDVRDDGAPLDARPLLHGELHPGVPRAQPVHHVLGALAVLGGDGGTGVVVVLVVVEGPHDNVDAAAAEKEAGERAGRHRRQMHNLTIEMKCQFWTGEEPKIIEELFSDCT